MYYINWCRISPIIYRGFYIPGGAGFLESTVCMTVLFLFSGCSLWRHQECEDLSFLGGNNLCFQNIPIPNQILSKTPASTPSRFFFLHHAQYIACLAMSAFLPFPLFFLGFAVSNQQQKINPKSGKKNTQKSKKKSSQSPAKVPLGQVQVVFFQYKHQLQLRCDETFHCLQHGRTAVYRGTHGPGHRSAIPADGKQGGLVYERPTSGKLTMDIQKWTLFLKM